MIEQYADINLDFTDAAIVSLAGQSKIRQLLTVDRRDFNIYRFADGSRFERLWV